MKVRSRSLAFLLIGKLSTSNAAWYINHDTKMCVDDSCDVGAGPDCGGVMPTWRSDSYPNADVCCSSTLWYKPRNQCTASTLNISTPQPSTPPPSSGPPTPISWHIDWNTSTCKKNCPVDPADPNCGGALEPYQNDGGFATAEDCCSQGIWWKKLGECYEMPPTAQPTTLAPSSGPPTPVVWFPDWDIDKCVKDCSDAADPNCATRPMENYDTPFPSAEACCDAKFGWMKHGECYNMGPTAQPSTAAPFSGPPTAAVWYPDWDKEKCVKDCTDPADPNCSTRVMYDFDIPFPSAEACCDAKFSWMKRGECYNMGPTAQPSTAAPFSGPPTAAVWFPDFDIDKCVKDCDDPTDPNCASRPMENWDIQFPSAEACCDAKFSWMKHGECFNMGPTAQPTTLAPSSGPPTSAVWYADMVTSQCLKSCTDAADPNCGGIKSEYIREVFSTPEDCCDTKLNWLSHAECYVMPPTLQPTTLAPSSGPPTPVKWYANYDDHTCVKNCAVDPTDPNCAGDIALESHQGDESYLTAEECCAKTAWWKSLGECYAMAPSLQPTTLAPTSGPPTAVFWYVQWENYKCVKSCPVSGSDVNCGGLATEFDPPYSTADLCCNQMKWLDRSECTN